MKYQVKKIKYFRVVSFAMLIVVILFQVIFPENTMALRPAVNVIRKAISQNIRQAIKPSFNITSRYSKAMLSITFSKYGDYFATVNANGFAQIWDAQTGQKIKNIHSNKGAIIEAVFSENSGFIALGTNTGELILWDIYQGAIKSSISVHSEAVSALIEIPDQGWLVSSLNGLIKLVDIQSGEISRRFYINDAGSVHCMSLNHKGDRLISGHDDGKIRVWNLFTSQIIYTIDGKGGAVYSTATSSDNVLAAALESGEVKLWNLMTGRKIFFEKRHHGPARSVSIDPNSTFIASGGDDGTIHVSVLGKKSEIILTGHKGRIHSICFHPVDDFLFTAGADKTARCWAWKQDQKEMARMVAMRDGWAVVTPDGFFDGTLDGDVDDRLESIQWNIENRAFSIDGFMENYYEPGLLGKILKGETIVHAKSVVDISQGFALPPKLTMSFSYSDKTTAAVRMDSVKLVVDAVDQGGGIDEIRVYHNQKALGEKNIVSDIQHKGKILKRAKTYEIFLVEGKNSFKAVGFSENRIESEPVEKQITATKPDQTIETTLHLVSIGINKYKNPMYDLNYAVPDARGMLDAISQLHADVFDVFTYYELYDQDATLENIKQQFKMLENLPPQDTVVVFIAGHGTISNKNWYYIPYDLFNPNLDSQLVKKGLSSNYLISEMTNIGARQVLLLLDCCKAGAVTDVFKDQKVLALVSRLAGIHVGAAATSEQNASELESMGHGLFTYALLKGLKGAADLKPMDGNITVTEMLAYTENEIPELVQEYKIPHQKPVINLRGADFLVAGTEKLE